MSNEAALEAQIHRSTPDQGYREDYPLPLGLARNSAGLILTGTTSATNPAVVAQGGSASPAPMIIKFPGSGTSACLACFDGRIPGEFLPVPSTEASIALDYDLHLLVPVRKVEATDIAGDVALKLDVVFSSGTPGAQGRALTAISNTIAAWVSDNTTDATGAVGFSVLDFDISAEIAAEILAGTITGTPPYFKPRDWFRLAIGPHATINASNYLEMFSPTLVFRRAAALYYSGSGTAGVNLGTNFRTIRGGGGG